MAVGLINRSDEFRKLIFRQSEKYNIPFAHICKHLGIDYNRFLSGYANIKALSDASAGKVLMKDQELMDIAKILGVDVRVMLVVKDEKKMLEDIDRVKVQLKDEYINSKKERVASKAK